jgi:hypothetical protein
MAKTRLVKTKQSVADTNEWLRSVDIPATHVLDNVTAEGGFIRLQYRDGVDSGRFSEIFLNSDGRPVIVYVYHLAPEPKTFVPGTMKEIQPAALPERFIQRLCVLILYVRSFFGRKRNG